MLHLRSRIRVLSLALLALTTIAPALPAQDQTLPLTPKDLVGEWVFYKDQSPPRPAGRLRPNQGIRFTGKLENEVLELQQVRPGDVVERVLIALDGSAKSHEQGGRTRTSSGRFENGVLHTELRIEAADPDAKSEPMVSKYTYTLTADGLLVRWQMLQPAQVENLCLYKRAEDIPRPTTATAKLDRLEWLAGDWTGTRGKAAIEERWGPIAGGAMLATARTVSGGRMTAFEYLRIVERDGSLVYIAQPNGRSATEFVLTQIEDGRARFENPLHDFPQRIEYVRTESGLRATISDQHGERAQTFEFQREAK